MQLRDAHGSETHSRLLLTRATDGIVVVDCRSRVLFVNPAACALLSVECEGLIGEPSSIRSPKRASQRAIKCSSPTVSVPAHRHLDRLDLGWSGSHDHSAAADPATEHPAEHSPEHSASMRGARVSEDRLRTVGRLAAGLAHEVNNPLTFVLANLESLRESHQAIRRFIRTLRVDLATQEAITPQSFERIMADASLQEVVDDAADMLTDCYKGMHRIQDIARSLGTFSRADDNQAEMMDITRIVDDACAMVFNQIRYRARLVKRFEPVPMIAAFPGRIAQALVNLLTNAAEAIDGGAYEQAPHRGRDPRGRRSRDRRDQRHRRGHPRGRPRAHLHAGLHHQSPRGRHGSGSHGLHARRQGARGQTRGAPPPGRRKPFRADHSGRYGVDRGRTPSRQPSRLRGAAQAITDPDRRRRRDGAFRPSKTSSAPIRHRHGARGRRSSRPPQRRPRASTRSCAI